MTVDEALTELERSGTRKTLEGMDRYGIVTEKAFGVTVGDTKNIAKRAGRDHALALALWPTGWYEARLLAAFVDEPGQVSVPQMEEWAADFDNWAVVDTVCFHLFDRTAHAWTMARRWADAEPEYTKRAAFALLWGLSVHDKKAPDGSFVDCLPLVEAAARDERTYVKKAVDMALRAVGKRNPALNRAALEVAERLAGSGDRTGAWIGRHAGKELRSPAVRRRLERKAGTAGKGK